MLKIKNKKVLKVEQYPIYKFEQKTDIIYGRWKSGHETYLICP